MMNKWNPYKVATWIMVHLDELQWEVTKNAENRISVNLGSVTFFMDPDQAGKLMEMAQAAVDLATLMIAKKTLDAAGKGGEVQEVGCAD